MITEELFRLALPSNAYPEVWSVLLDQILPEYEIDTALRIAAFVSQTGHESLDYTVLKENLNYSAKGLRGTFGKYFNESQALSYQRKPEAIASRVYANRMGNGDEQSGDGWAYRGRGILQITGRSNYEACSEFLYEDDSLVIDPDQMLHPEVALRAACWYWSVNNLNDIADTGDVEKLTKRINGGLNGLDDRVSRYNKVIDYLNAQQ